MRVMIVEDEYYSRKALVKMLKQLTFDLDICAEAETGREAVAYLETAKVDLVITDIRMPEMDGIELAGYIAGHCPDTGVMITSGYSDFGYAQQAIRYGVKSYLLKPVRPDELGSSIADFIQEQQNRKNELTRLTKEQVSQEAFRYLSIPFIMESGTMLSVVKKRCGDQFGQLPYRLFLFQGSRLAKTGDTAGFCDQIHERLSAYHTSHFHFLHQKEVVVLVFGGHESLNDQKLPRIIGSLLTDTEISCGYSRIYHEITELGEAYRDGIYAINRRLLDENSRLFEYQSEMELRQLLSEQDEHLLYEYVLKGDYGQAKGIAEQFLAQCEDETRDVYSLYSGIMRIFSAVSKAFGTRESAETLDEQNRYLLFSFKSDLYQFQSMADLKDYILNVIKNTCNSQETVGENRIIEEIKAYVERNYRYDIALGELACHKYFLNPSYLSRLFKQETGMNFSRYLKEYRLSQAKELLKNTDFKISEIADCVGFNDASYFSLTFRRRYQMTPEQYRNKK